MVNISLKLFLILNNAAFVYAVENDLDRPNWTNSIDPIIWYFEQKYDVLMDITEEEGTDGGFALHFDNEDDETLYMLQSK